jgi:hypothetical protein
LAYCHRPEVNLITRRPDNLFSIVIEWSIPGFIIPVNTGTYPYASPVPEKGMGEAYEGVLIL